MIELVGPLQFSLPRIR